jgi:hypothetical protein
LWRGQLAQDDRFLKDGEAMHVAPTTFLDEPAEFRRGDR